jgi:TctA family transporter
MSLMDNLLLGLQTACQPVTLLYCFLGVTLGTFVGVMPGIGAIAAISLLLPVTYYMDPTVAIIAIAGIYYGTAYGGSTASILLNLPGQASAVVTCLDGHPMAMQGRAGVALFACAIGSFIGAIFGITILILFSPVIAAIGLSFGPAEYFSLILLGLVAASAVATGSAIKSLAMVFAGLLLGTVGTDINSGVPRFHFGILELRDSVSLVAVAMGIFGLAEVIRSINNVPSVIHHSDITLRSMLPTREDIRRSIGPVLRGSGIGSFFGALPGTGMDVASFTAYAVEKRVARDPSRFGKGAIEGVIGPETANNAAGQTAFVPTMTLGIPSNAVMALVLGALIIHGIAPGPTLITKEPQLFWGLVVSFIIGNVMLLILNIPMISIWVRMMLIPYNILYPIIVILICFGVYSVNNSVFDVYLVALFGVVGYVMVLLRFEAAPLLLGLVLGPMLEERMVRALVISGGDASVFLTRPISGVLLVATIALLIWIIRDSFRATRYQAPAEST